MLRFWKKTRLIGIRFLILSIGKIHLLCLQNKSQIWQLTDSASSTPISRYYFLPWQQVYLLTVLPASIPWLISIYSHTETQPELSLKRKHIIQPFLDCPSPTPTKVQWCPNTLKVKIQIPFLLRGSLYMIFEKPRSQTPCTPTLLPGITTLWPH